MAQLEINKATFGDKLSSLSSKHRIQQVPCRDRWTGRCLNQECWAFHNINGQYFCIKDGFEANQK